MSGIGQKPFSMQMFRLMVYCRALHPELFDLQGRRCHRQHEYESENWILPGGHVVRFQHGGYTLSEVVIDMGDHLPEQGLIHALPCIGEKDFEIEDQSRLGYVTTVQTEVLTENLYRATYEEMTDFAREIGALWHAWESEEGGQQLSILDTQNYRREFHIQSYHLVESTGTVLRTQSIFEIPSDAGV